ncbi:DUF2815 family protein [Undibacterium sp. Di26W]|uniref:DUF2815 family protein n=1 Tax=Undibacterium sp. Di26W TaxID=3413035 RepID=UPI003BF36978
MAKILLKNVRLAFSSIFEAKTVNGEGEPAFSASFLLPPDHPQIKELEALQEQVIKDKWTTKAAQIKKEMVTKDRLAIHDGDAKADYDGFPGNLFISARNKSRPSVFDRDKTPLTQADGKPYSGCYVNVSIELWAQDNSYGKRVNASLRGVQFYRDGDAFAGGGAASEDEFEAEDGADDGPLA